MRRTIRLHIFLIPIGSLLASCFFGVSGRLWIALFGLVGLILVSLLTRRWRSSVRYRETIWAIIIPYLLFAVPAALYGVLRIVVMYANHEYRSVAHEVLTVFALIFMTTEYAYIVRLMRRNRTVSGFGKADDQIAQST
jgi:hypothetical protein